MVSNEGTNDPTIAATASRTVLVVDDHPFNADIASDMLIHLGFIPQVARSGLEAVEAFDPDLHDLILMDLQMPDLNGLEATQRIRGEHGQAVPIIALTANVGAEDRQACFDAGMDDFIGKPFGLAELKAKLDHWIGASPPRQGKTSVLRSATRAVMLASALAAAPLSAQDGLQGLLGEAPSVGAESFRWKTAGGNYVDPASFFSLHGYVDGVFAGKSAEWTTRDPAVPGMPGQVLVPNTNYSSFQYDAALFVGSELSETTRLMMEWHLVSDPSGRGAAGPGGLTMVMTEGTASWDLVPSYLTLSGGIFWAPFATINRDWLGAQNLFTLIPIASGIFPAHLNERGVRLDGAHTFSPSTAVNYVVSVGNGTESFDISGQSAYDQNENKTIVSRVGVFPGLHQQLEVGLSVASGALRESEDLTRDADDPLRYLADFQAIAADFRLSLGSLSVRGYAGGSEESLADAGASDLPSLGRRGRMLEAAYALATDLPFGIETLVPKVRADFAQTDVLAGPGTDASQFRSSVYSLGATVSPHRQTRLSLEYHFRQEHDRLGIANDRFIVRFSAEF